VTPPPGRGRAPAEARQASAAPAALLSPGRQTEPAMTRPAFAALADAPGRTAPAGGNRARGKGPTA